MKQNTTAIYDVDTLNILSPDKIGLTETESGYLEFSYDGRDYDCLLYTSDAADD